MAKFVIRLDDICPTMDHAKFARARAFFEAAGVRPLMGIVPDNHDPDLQIDAADPDFWPTMRGLKAEGWGISQHGYQHKIHTGDYGLLGISPRSEFAGRTLEQQQSDLAKGLEILTDEGLGTDIFMAPFHSYDRATLTALKSLGFKRLTDGYGLFPWREHGLRFVPQLFERPANFGLGTYTMCLHLNNMSMGDIDKLGEFVAKRSARIVSFDEASTYNWPVFFAKPLELFLKFALTAKRRALGSA